MRGNVVKRMNTKVSIKGHKSEYWLHTSQMTVIQSLNCCFFNSITEFLLELNEITFTKVSGQFKQYYTTRIEKWQWKCIHATLSSNSSSFIIHLNNKNLWSTYHIQDIEFCRVQQWMINSSYFIFWRNCNLRKSSKIWNHNRTTHSCINKIDNKYLIIELFIYWVKHPAGMEWNYIAIRKMLLMWNKN